MKPLSTREPGRERDDFDRAFDRIGRRLPTWAANAVAWLCAPGRWVIRVPAALVFMLGGLFWFLPVVGIEMLPIGLALLAIDIPFLRGPVGRLLLWVDAKCTAVARWWKNSALAGK